MERTQRFPHDVRPTSTKDRQTDRQTDREDDDMNKEKRKEELQSQHL